MEKRWLDVKLSFLPLVLSTDGPLARKLKTSSMVDDSPENELILKFVGQRWRAIAASYQPKGVARLEWQSGQGMRTKNQQELDQLKSDASTDGARERRARVRRGLEGALA